MRTVEDSIAAYRAALALPIDRPAVRTEALVGLAQALRARHGAAGGLPEHLAEMQLLAGELSAQYPPGHPDRADIVAKLADPPAERIRPGETEQVTRQAQQLVDLASLSSSDGPERHGSLAPRSRRADWPASVGPGWPPNRVTSIRRRRHTD